MIIIAYNLHNIIEKYNKDMEEDHNGGNDERPPAVGNEEILKVLEDIRRLLVRYQNNFI